MSRRSFAVHGLVQPSLCTRDWQVSARDEGPNNIGELIALPRESPDVVSKALPGLLDALLHILGQTRACVCSQEVAHKLPLSSN